MKGLLLRLSALDADAATAVRVIAHFEALLGGGLDPVSLTRSTAALAGCAAGLELPDGRAARFGPAGVALPGAPEQVSGRVDLEPAGRVWLERPGAPGPFDELVLEWMAITARVLAGRPRQTRVPSAADPALVELVLSGREDASDRARALDYWAWTPRRRCGWPRWPVAPGRTSGWKRWRCWDAARCTASSEWRRSGPWARCWCSDRSVTRPVPRPVTGSRAVPPHRPRSSVRPCANASATAVHGPSRTAAEEKAVGERHSRPKMNAQNDRNAQFCFSC